MGMLATKDRFCSVCFGKQRSLSAMKWVLPKVFVEKSCPLTSDKPKL